MGGWVEVARVDEFPPDTHRVVEDGGTFIAVFNLDGEYYAIEDICTHDGGDLAGGEVEGDEVICPRHGARFCIRTGAVTAPPAYEPVASLPVKIEDGAVYTRDDRWD